MTLLVPDMKETTEGLVASTSHRLAFSKHTFKYFYDCVCAVLLLCLIAPVMLMVAVCVKLDGGGPILFRQQRVGRNGRLFYCLKFRSMVPNAGAMLEEHLAKNESARREWVEKQKLTFDPRVTAIGNFLRRSSLDELPQLFNVVVGDMSLVGPRPILPSECVRYEDRISDYLSVRPGLTGLWQVKGRSDTTYAERVALDTHYVRNQSLALDIKILFLTVGALFSQRGSR